MGYKNPDDIDDNWLMTEKQANSNDHLFLRFDKNDFIRIYCQEALAMEAPS